MTFVWVFIGGGLGSLLRYGVGKMSMEWFTTNFPLGTFLSNMFACVILALIIYLMPNKESNPWIHPFLIIGLCGGFSTFSTFSFETVKLIEMGQIGVAVINVLVSILVGTGLIFWVKSIR